MLHCEVQTLPSKCGEQNIASYLGNCASYNEAITCPRQETFSPASRTECDHHVPYCFPIERFAPVPGKEYQISHQKVHTTKFI